MDSYKLKNINGTNNLHELKLVKIDIPEIKNNEVLIKVKSVSLNFRDNMVIRGDFGNVNDLTPVSDVVGEIVKIGDQVNRNDLKIGQRVTSNFCTDWIDNGESPSGYSNTLGGPINGGLAEYMVLKGDAVVIPPEYLTDDEVTTLPIAALTAYHSLVVLGKLSANQYVLIQGTGGVSLFAIQIASAIGAKSIVLTSSNEKADKVKALGADHVINYVTTPDWHNEVLKITNGAGVHHTLEVVGGSGINKSIDSTKRHGNIFIVGLLDSSNSNIDLLKIIGKRINLIGILVGPKHSFDEMNKFFTQYKIKPVIEKVYNFNQVDQAYNHLKKGAFGKIVINIQ